MTAYLVAGLAFGDEGKGSVVDFLVRKTGARIVVRYNGGPQAAHNVVTTDGRHHEFHQFGSGSFVPGVGTYISRFMPIEPFAMVHEAEELWNKIGRDPMQWLCVEESCRVITPFHWIANQLREEARGTARHGSCGMGVGELREDEMASCPQLLARDLKDPLIVLRKLDAIKTFKLFQMHGSFETKRLEEESIEELAKFYTQFSARLRTAPNGSLKIADGPFVFEGAQGVLLDQAHGFHPYSTWSNCTFGNAISLCSSAGITDLQKIGVLRTYFTRHGPGPFVTENGHSFPDHNKDGRWQGPFRQGNFDLVAARYAIRCLGGIDRLALTHCDKFPLIPCVEEYEIERSSVKELRMKNNLAETLFNAKPGKFRHRKYSELGLGPILLESYGQTADDKLIRDEK